MAGARVVTHPKTVLVTVPWKGPPSTSAMRGAMTVPSSNNLAQTRNDPDLRTERQNAVRQLHLARNLAVSGQISGGTEPTFQPTVGRFAGLLPFRAA